MTERRATLFMIIHYNIVVSTNHIDVVPTLL
jgi:hypothetical protein